MQKTNPTKSEHPANVRPRRYASPSRPTALDIRFSMVRVAYELLGLVWVFCHLSVAAVIVSVVVVVMLLVLVLRTVNVGDGTRTSHGILSHVQTGAVALMAVVRRRSALTHRRCHCSVLVVVSGNTGAVIGTDGTRSVAGSSQSCSGGSEGVLTDDATVGSAGQFGAVAVVSHALSVVGDVCVAMPIVRLFAHIEACTTRPPCRERLHRGAIFVIVLKFGPLDVGLAVIETGTLSTELGEEENKTSNECHASDDAHTNNKRGVVG